MSVAAGRGASGGHPLILAAVVAFAALWLVPVLYVVVLSFKPNETLMLSQDSVLLPPFTLENYRAIWETSAVFRWFANSVIVSLVAMVLVLTLSSLAGYGFARARFPGRDALFVIVLLGLAIPEQAVIIPRHQLFIEWDLHNTYVGLVLPHLALPFGVFLMTPVLPGHPRRARRGSDTRQRVALQDFSGRVLLPQTIPAQATLGIFTFLIVWNDYFWPLISATDPEMYTLTLGLAATQTMFAQSEGLGFLMAQAVFAGVPALVVYVLFQRHIINAASGGAGR